MDAASMNEVEELLAPMLKRRLFVCLSEQAEGVGAEEILAVLPEHLRYVIGLEQQGSLFAAGPLLEDGEPGSRGLFILRAADEAEARALLDAEPMHRRGLRTYELNEWSLNEGRITVNIDFSSQRGGLDAVPPAPPAA